MRTYVDVFINVDKEKVSTIFNILTDMGLKYHIGDHDFIYDWKRIVPISEEIQLIDEIQERLKGTGAILRFISIL